MCLVFISLRKHPVYKLIVATNRDEFYIRKTKEAEFWSEHQNVLAGRDLEAGGTWLGVTKQGKFSLITNFRDPKNINPDAPSRGQLVSDYLIKEINANDYLKNIEPNAKAYNGFNLLAGTLDELHYLSNYGSGIETLSSGVWGLSNHLLETPWPKIVKGKRKFEQILKQSIITTEALFDMLYDDAPAPDDLLPETGVGLERERMLSSMFIKSPNYGTRCSTVILVDQNN